MRRFIKDSTGAALPLVIMVFMVMFILGFAIIQISMADATQSIWQNTRVQAHYVARSGVYHGLEMLDSKLSGPNLFTGTIDELITELQGGVASSYTLSDAGSYNITFSRGIYSGEIKITSVGTASGKFSSSKTVTYTRHLGMNSAFSNPAGEWMTGINLDKGISPSNPNKSFLGHAVLLESKNKNPIQSPKGSSNPSTFQASIIVLQEYEGTSLKQINNSIDLSFDGELIYFLGDIEFNSGTDSINLLSSNDIIKQRHNTLYNGSYPNPTGVTQRSPALLDSNTTNGFESEQRYLDMISDNTVTDRTPDPTFNTGIYGIVKFGGDILD
ncbi:MAG: hypothetical protein K8R73_02875, partial [Clostridiales bacterium]|nr:hypothetical protein [Clostridiales bacterium]